MKSKLWLAVALLGLALAPVSAQQVSTPALNAIAGAYNTTTPSITAGKFGLVQVDATGRLIVSCTNCGAATITGINVNGPFNVTVTNNATGPVIVSSPSGFGGAGGASNVTVTNIADGVDVTQGAKADSVCSTATGTCTVTALLKYANNALSSVVTGLIPTGTASTPASQVLTIQGITAMTPVLVSVLNPTAQGTAANVTVTNTVANPAVVSCTNCGAASITSVTVGNTTSNPVPVTISNVPLLVSIPNAVTLATSTNMIGRVTILNNAAGPVLVSVLNSTGPYNVTVTNSNPNGAAASASSSPVVIATDQATITVRNALAVNNGWTMILLNGLTTTKTTIKNAAGQLGKLYCYNPDATNVAYVQVFDALTGSVTLGTTSPKNSYAIPATQAAGFAFGNVGDQFATAISIAATTTVAGLTAPSTALNCNASYN